VEVIALHIEDGKRIINKKEYNFSLAEKIDLPGEINQIEDLLVKVKKIDSKFHREKLSINGELIESVIYLTGVGSKEAKVERVNFKHFLADDELDLDQNYKVELDIEQIQYKLKDTDKDEKALIIKIEFQLILLIIDSSGLLFHSASSYPPSFKNVEVKRLILKKFLSSEEDEILIKEEWDLISEAVRVFDLRAKLIEIRSKKVKTQILIKGLILYEILLLTDAGDIKYVEFKKPFKENGNFREVKFDVELMTNSKIKELEFIESRGKVRIISVVQVSITTYQEVEVSLYTNPTRQGNELIKAKQEVNCLQEEWLEKDKLKVDLDYQELIELKGRVTDIKEELIADKVILSGKFIYELYYIDKQGKKKRKEFNSNFHRLLLFTGSNNELKLDYQLQITDLQSSLKDKQLKIKTFLKFVGRLDRELLVCPLTRQSNLLENGVLNYFLVERILEIDQEKFLFSYEIYLKRYAEQIQKVGIEIIDFNSKLLNEVFLFSCQLKYFISFIDKNDIEEEVTELRNVYQIFSIKNVNEEVNLDLTPEIEYIDYDLIASGEKLFSKAVINLQYQIAEDVKIPILVKNISEQD
jgi:hypothetical protein